MAQPGDVVNVEFPGATGTKRRPAVVVSRALYHAMRPDVILGVLNSQVANAPSPSDHVLQDWEKAGLRRPSLFRAFLATLPATTITVAGRLSERDWQAVRQSVRAALAIG